MRLLLLFLVLAVQVNSQCTVNTCVNVTSPVGFRDDNNRPEIVNADCCYNSITRQTSCYLSDYQQCGNDGTNTGDVMCFKKGYVPCNGGCCSTNGYRCEVYEEKNGHKVSRCVVKMDNKIGFVVVTVPLMLTLFTILGVVVLFIYSKDIFQQEDILDKVSGAFSFLIIFFAIFYYYSHVWVYGVVMVVTSAIGLRTLPATDLPTRFVAFFAYLFLFYAVTGWGLDNGWIGGWGSGNIFEFVYSCPTYNYFERNPGTSAKWISDVSAVRAGKDASLRNQPWGYCDSGWLFTLAFFGLLEVFFISFMLISTARRLFQHSSPAPKGGLREPFLS